MENIAYIENNNRIFYKVKKIGGNISKILQINDINNSEIFYAVKIYSNDIDSNRYYDRELSALEKISLSNNDGNKYLIKSKKLNGRIDFKNLENEVKDKGNYFIFDFYKNQDIKEYLIYLPGLIEDYVKLIVYKILKGLEICHNTEIYHNNLKLGHILLDDNYNPIIIDFSKSSSKKSSYKKGGQNFSYNKDFIDLAAIILKLISSEDYNFIIKNGEFCLKIEQKVVKDIWKYLSTKEVKYTKEFQDFLKKLINNNNTIKAEDLLKHNWFKDIKDKKMNELENNLILEFKDRYNKRKKDIRENQNFDLDISPYIDSDSSSDLLKCFSSDVRSLEENDYQKYTIPTIYVKPSGLLSNYIEINVINHGAGVGCFEKLDIIPNNFFSEFIIELKKEFNCDINFTSNESSINISFGDNSENNSNINNKKNDYDDNDNDNTNEDDDEDDSEELNIKLELFKYIENLELKSLFLKINCISGDEFFFYQQIKRISILVKNLIRKNYIR